MYLEKEFVIEETSPCMADKTKLKAVTKAPKDLTELLPYFHAEFPNATYRGDSLEFQRDGIRFTLVDSHVNIAKFDNMTHLYELLDWLTEWINDVAARRDSITPNHQQTQFASPMEIYKHLPKTNCKQCGFGSGMAFAGAVSRRNAQPSQCPVLEKDRLEQLEQLCR